MNNIGKIVIVSITDAAVAVETKQRTFIIANTGSTAIYIKEKCIDGVVATAVNGFLIPANTVSQPLVAESLSIFGANGSTASIMYLEYSSQYS